MARLLGLGPVSLYVRYKEHVATDASWCSCTPPDRVLITEGHMLRTIFLIYQGYAILQH